MSRYSAIASSIDYLVSHYEEGEDLTALAGRAGYEATHFQKLFKEMVGISPKRLCQYMRMKHAGELLAAGANTLDAAYEAGLSGSGRLHDLCVSCVGLTPGHIKSRGEGLKITYGFHATPLGEILLAKTAKGVCYLGFLMDEARDEPVRKMKAHWPLASFEARDEAINEEAQNILCIWRDQGDPARPLKLDLYGTNLQIQVWQALLKIPLGKTRTYSEIAEEVGRPKAARAIGNAVGKNPVSLLIPCHRVIRATGIIDNYGWGSARKKLILGMESEIENIPN